MPTPSFRLIIVSFAEAEEAIRKVRTEVFIREQEVPYDLEWDGEDPDCEHVVALDGSENPVGTARLRPDGKLGRMAVARSFRGRGVGSAMLKALLNHARETGLDRIVLDAQTRVIPFYESHGFVAEGPEFMDANIPHRKMHRSL